MVGSREQRRAEREPGASPGRSRRCQGRCSPPDATGPPGREGRRGPRVRRPTARLQPNPSRKEDSCSDGLSRFSWWHCSRSPSPQRPLRRSSASGSRARRGRSSARAARPRSQPAGSPRSGQLRRRVLRQRPADLVRPLRRAGRSLRGLGLERLGVQGERHIAFGRRRQGRAQGRRRRALVLGDVFRQRRPAHAPARARRPGLLHGRPAERRRDGVSGDPGPCSTSTPARSRPALGRACIRGHARPRQSDGAGSGALERVAVTRAPSRRRPCSLPVRWSSPAAPGAAAAPARPPSG